MERVVEIDSPSVISAYEKKLAKLEREKALLAEKTPIHRKPRGYSGGVVRTRPRIFIKPLENMGKYEKIAR
ncbi:MAG: hypothetical protein AAF813_00700 [Pseudomonadota bacterium]